MTDPARKWGLLTVGEAAEYLRVSERTIRNYVRHHDLEPVALPGCVRFRLEDLDAWVANRVSRKSIAQPAVSCGGTASPSTASGTVSQQVLETIERLKQKPKRPTRRRRSVIVQFEGDPTVRPLRPR